MLYIGKVAHRLGKPAAPNSLIRVGNSRSSTSAMSQRSEVAVLLAFFEHSITRFVLSSCVLRPVDLPRKDVNKPLNAVTGKVDVMRFCERLKSHAESSLFLRPEHNYLPQGPSANPGRGDSKNAWIPPQRGGPQTICTAHWRLLTSFLWHFRSSAEPEGPADCLSCSPTGRRRLQADGLLGPETPQCLAW